MIKAILPITPLVLFGVYNVENNIIRAINDRLLNTNSNVNVTTYDNLSTLCNDLKNRRNDRFVILTSAYLANHNAEAFIPQLRKYLPDAKVLVIDSNPSLRNFLSVLRSGAAGYLTNKDLENCPLSELVQDAAEGKFPLNRDLIPSLLDLLLQGNLDAPMQIDQYSPLTSREKQILDLLRLGLQPKRIASRLNISYETVRTHTKNIYKKLHVNSLTEILIRPGIQDLDNQMPLNTKKMNRA